MKMDRQKCKIKRLKKKILKEVWRDFWWKYKFKIITLIWFKQHWLEPWDVNISVRKSLKLKILKTKINSWNHTFHTISLEGHWMRPNGFRIQMLANNMMIGIV